MFQLSDLYNPMRPIGVVIALSAVPDGTPPVVLALVGVMSGILMGVVVGAMTGVALVWMLRTPHSNA